MPPADDRLTAFLDAARVEIDHALERYLPKPPACPAIVSEAMRYSIFAGGKRLRPVLTLAAADAVARSPRGLIYYAAESSRRRCLQRSAQEIRAPRDGSAA